MNYTRWRQNHLRVLEFLQAAARPYPQTVSTAGGLSIRLFPGEVVLTERRIAAALGLGRQVVRSAIAWLNRVGHIKKRFRPINLYKCPCIIRVAVRVAVRRLFRKPKGNPEGSMGCRFLKKGNHLLKFLSSVKSGIARQALKAFTDEKDALKWAPLVFANVSRFHKAGLSLWEIPLLVRHASAAGNGQGPLLSALFKARLRDAALVGVRDLLNIREWLGVRPVESSPRPRRPLSSKSVSSDNISYVT